MELLGWVPSAPARDHRKCQQSESQENPSSQRGWMQTGACLTDAPDLEEGRRGWRASRGASGSASLRCWRAPPRARASRKGGRGESLPRARRAPRELLGCCTQEGPVTGGVSAWSSWALSRRRLSWAAQRLLGGHTAAGAWYWERLSLRQLVPPRSTPSPRGGLATVRALPRASWPGTTPGPPSRSSCSSCPPSPV